MWANVVYSQKFNSILWFIPAFSDPDDSKYVQFSEDVDPQVTLTKI